jgi:MSHA biogenesis protein MshO
VLLAEHIQTLDDSDGDGLIDDVVDVFSYTAGTLQRAAIVHLDFRFRDPSEDDEWVRFSQEVSVRNAP